MEDSTSTPTVTEETVREGSNDDQKSAKKVDTMETNIPDVGNQPHQPKKLFPKRKSGSHKRTCQTGWFQKWNWLHYDENSDSVFCFTCITAIKENKLSNPFTEKAFIFYGYNNWKKATERFEKHAKSKSHQEAVQRVIILPQCTKDIGESLSTEMEEKRKENRHCLLKLLSCLQFLARQGLALRGDKTEIDSNFLQLLAFQAKNDPILRSWLKRKTDRYTSPEIQNLLLEIMANTVLRQVISPVQEGIYFAIMADECADVSNKKQLVVCIRWIDENFEGHEEFLGFYELENIEAKTIFEAINDVIQRLNLSWSQCRGQCFDMAAAMAGLKKRVASVIKNMEPRAVYTHCYGHALNLACSDTIKNCSLLRDTLDNIREITKLIKESPRREGLFKKIKAMLNVQHAMGIRVLCPTRWTVKADTIDSVMSNYDVLLEVWDEALEYVKDSEMKSRIRGVSAYMRTFNFLFGANLAVCILRNSDNLSKSLQGNVSAACGQKMAAATLSVLESLRTDEHFTLFWQTQKTKATQLDIPEPVLSRKKRPPKRLDDGDSGAPPHAPQTVEDHYRQVYFTALDLVTNCIRDRFDQPGYRIYKNLEMLLLNAAGGSEYQNEVEIVCNFYGSDIDRSALATQLNVLSVNTKKITETKELDVSDVMAYVKETGGLLFTEVVKLIKLIQVMPSTNSTSERSFSSLRRLKTYLRSSTTQRRLNNLMVLHVHRDKTDTLSLEETANDFVRRSEHRMFTFGKF